MTPAKMIADLDAALARAGTPVTLRRLTTPSPTDLVVPASARSYMPEEITGGIKAGDEKLVLSPTGLDDAAWVAAFSATGGQSLAAPFDVSPNLPKAGDKVVVNNRLRSIAAVMPVRVAGTVVRIEAQAR